MPESDPISVVLLADAAPKRLPASLQAALSSGAVREVVPVIGRYDRLAAGFAEAVGSCAADVVYPLTPDAVHSEGAWAAITSTAAAHPEAAAFRLQTRGLRRDPRWRGRRARGFERNLESLRFANLLPLGALAFRRHAVLTASRAPDAGADWWRRLVADLSRSNAFVDAPAEVRRPGRLSGEPYAPSHLAPIEHEGGEPSVLVFGELEVSTSLYFDFLQIVGNVRFRAPSQLDIDAPHLAAADLVILVRELHRFYDDGVIELLDRLGVPYVYFADENFQILREEGRARSFYRPRRVAEAVSGAAEVWASTAPLASALQPLHPRVRTWGPVLDPCLVQAPEAHEGPLTIGFAGGDFRLPSFRGPLIDRLKRLARERKLRILLTPAAARDLAPELVGADVVVPPIEQSFRQFVYRWRSLGVDILLHPAAATANAPFKAPTAAISAGYLGAIPLVDDEPAYSGWDEGDGLLRLGAGARGLDAAIDAATQPEQRRRMTKRLAASLAHSFGDAHRIGRLLALAHTPRRRPPKYAKVLASPGFRARRAALRLARAARRFVDVADAR